MDAGARDVIIDWSDDFITRQRYLKAQESVFSEFPSYSQAKFDYLVAHSCPVLNIIGSDPEMLKGVDSNRIQTWQRTSGGPTRPYYDAMTSGAFQWSIRRAPHPGLGGEGISRQTGDEAIDALWEAFCRLSRHWGRKGCPTPGGSTWKGPPPAAGFSTITAFNPSTIPTALEPI